MEYWTNPDVVARFRWRVWAYRFAYAIAWSGILLGVLAGFFFGQSKAFVGVLLFGPLFVTLLILSVVWRCSNCSGRLNYRSKFLSHGACCDQCGAVLYEPSGVYDAPSPPRKPASPPREPASSPDDGNDVDAMAEAEVYVAYGYKTQAIEVLQEALQSDPARADIANKLAELQAQPADKR
jgi:hypothetical protein